MPLWSGSSKDGAFASDSKSFRCESLLLQFSDRARMDSLNVSGNVLRDEFLAFGKDLPQRASVAVGPGFLK